MILQYSRVLLCTSGQPPTWQHTISLLTAQRILCCPTSPSPGSRPRHPGLTVQCTHPSPCCPSGSKCRAHLTCHECVWGDACHQHAPWPLCSGQLWYGSACNLLREELRGLYSGLSPFAGELLFTPAACPQPRPEPPARSRRWGCPRGRARCPPGSSPSAPPRPAERGCRCPERRGAGRQLAEWRAAAPRAGRGLCPARHPASPGCRARDPYCLTSVFSRKHSSLCLWKTPAFPASASSATQLAALPSTFLCLVEKIKVDEN